MFRDGTGQSLQESLPQIAFYIKLEVVLQNNYLTILHPEELVCVKLSTHDQAKDYSGLENDRVHRSRHVFIAQIISLLLTEIFLN